MPRFVLQVRFTVSAENLQQAREKVQQVLEHGEQVHGHVLWEWMNRPRSEDPT
jgi:hypothetical protein